MSSTAVSEDPKRLYRSRIDRMIGGVCGGVAEYAGVDSTVVRVLWIISAFFGGLGVVAYLAALVIVPENPQQRGFPPPERKLPKQTNVLWGVVLILIGLYFLSRQLGFYALPWRWFWPWHYEWGTVWPVVLVVIGVAWIYYVLRKEKQIAGGGPSMTSSATEGGGKRLTRSKSDRMIAGVCGGLAKYLNIDPSIVRIAWALITVFTGFIWGAIAYILMLFIVPEEGLPGGTATTPARPPESKPAG